MHSENQQVIKNLLALSLRTPVFQKVVKYENLQELRLRVNKPVFLRYANMEIEIPHIVTQEDLAETLEYITGYSLYAYEQEIGQGYLTITGGHRVGICGKVIWENGSIKSMQYISSINIRVSHEQKGCAAKLFPCILNQGNLCHTFILSPPGCGKTTLLRDLVREVSDGNEYIQGHQVGVVDERSEIGGCYQGIPQNDIGKRTDILDACPKAEGMMQLVRTMSPQVIAVDEIGTKKDMDALAEVMHCGVILFVTAHGTNMADIKANQLFASLLEAKWFQRIIILKKEGHVGTLDGIYDGEGQKLCG